MLKVILQRIIFVLLILALSSCGGSSPASRPLTIAVASNMHAVMEEVAAYFSAEHGIAVEVASGSSGVLSAQIYQGAPFDVLLSANMLYPNALEEAGLTDGGASVFAYGSLILWSMDGSELDSGIDSLADTSIEKFAIANPEIAPYGIAAMEALENSAMIDVLKDKMILGESIAQVNQYVSSGAVQVGFTSSSVLYSSSLFSSGKSKAVDPSLYNPIEQVIVILKNGADNNSNAARLFHQFMFSPGVKTILTDYGYEAV